MDARWCPGLGGSHAVSPHHTARGWQVSHRFSCLEQKPAGVGGQVQKGKRLQVPDQAEGLLLAAVFESPKYH